MAPRDLPMDLPVLTPRAAQPQAQYGTRPRHTAAIGCRQTSAQALDGKDDTRRHNACRVSACLEQKRGPS